MKHNFVSANVFHTAWTCTAWRKEVGQTKYRRTKPDIGRRRENGVVQGERHIHTKVDDPSIVMNFLCDINTLLDYRLTDSLTEMMWPPKPWAASAHSITALSWGYPTPVFLRVVHTEPEERRE